MTDREAMKMALNALHFNFPVIEDYGSKEQLDIHHEAIMVLHKALAQPEQEPVAKNENGSIKWLVDGHIHTCTPPAQVALNKKAEKARDLGLDYEPEQEPVAWMQDSIELYVNDRPTSIYKIPLYTAPPKREWIGLTSEDWENTPDTGKQGCERDAEIFDWIEQTLKDKNT